MKKLKFILGLFWALCLCIHFSSCEKDTEEVPEPAESSEPSETSEDSNTANALASQFVYDGMSLYYLWADEMEDKKPADDSEPMSYFESILNKTDKDHGWSFITDDVQGLLAELSGEPVDFGFSLMWVAANSAATEFYAFITYVFPNTPASEAGLKRLDMIGKIDGETITESNYLKLYGSGTVTLSMYSVANVASVGDITLTPRVIATDPLLYKNIYEIDGKKIAYLFYTDFLESYNSSLYEAFAAFKQEGVTDLVLDLRYNHGGYISSAIYLGSLIAPQSDVQRKAPFVVMSYNSLMNGYFDFYKYSRSYSLGEYTAETEPNPLDANLNLNTVYIIATGDSYSAAELLAYCLKPYMNVVHIGENTGGKYTASMTIHPYDEEIGVPIYDTKDLSSDQKKTFENWAMQPIVAKYTNHRNEDFSAPGYLIPDYEVTEGGGYVNNWKPIGDTDDMLFGQAIYLITGNDAYRPSAQKVIAAAGVRYLTVPSLSNPKDIRKDVVLLDNMKMPTEKLRKAAP